jgi:hypothetical protein
VFTQSIDTNGEFRHLKFDEIAATVYLGFITFLDVQINYVPAHYVDLVTIFSWTITIWDEWPRKYSIYYNKNWAKLGFISNTKSSRK